MIRDRTLTGRLPCPSWCDYDAGPAMPICPNNPAFEFEQKMLFRELTHLHKCGDHSTNKGILVDAREWRRFRRDHYKEPIR